jgi:hypothetical protein
MMKKLYNFIVQKIKDYKRKKMINKRLEELRKRDPFVYKH